MPNFQTKVSEWMLECFGHEISSDGVERNHRFLEESLELTQSLGLTHSEANQLVDYVFNRPLGEPSQEVGGVMVTLAGLCQAHGLDMEINGATELARIWACIEKIRAKQAAKPKDSPLPEFSVKLKKNSTNIKFDTPEQIQIAYEKVKSGDWSLLQFNDWLRLGIDD